MKHTINSMTTVTLTFSGKKRLEEYYGHLDISMPPSWHRSSVAQTITEPLWKLILIFGDTSEDLASCFVGGILDIEEARPANESTAP